MKQKIQMYNEPRYLLNAFSLGMINKFPARIKATEVTRDEVFNYEGGLISAIGHADTANVLGVECNRISVTLFKRCTAYVAQLQGGRLTEGTKELPEGFSFTFLKVEVY